MQQSDREEATDYAKRQIDDFLLRRYYTSAILLASIYVDIRLTSLLTDRLSPSKAKWEEIASVVRNLNLSQKIRLCKSKGILENRTFARELHKLREKRNKLA